MKRDLTKKEALLPASLALTSAPSAPPPLRCHLLALSPSFVVAGGAAGVTWGSLTSFLCRINQSVFSMAPSVLAVPLSPPPPPMELAS